MQIFMDNMYVRNLTEAVTKPCTATLLRVCLNGKFHSSPDAVPPTAAKLFSKALLRLLYQKDLFTMGGK
jgi:hypothetical protein